MQVCRLLACSFVTPEPPDVPNRAHLQVYSAYSWRVFLRPRRFVFLVVLGVLGVL